MKPICAACGRRTVPFAYIGQEPIGPNCARKLNLTKKSVKAAKGGSLRLADRPSRAAKRAAVADTHTIDLFPETL